MATKWHMKIDFMTISVQSVFRARENSYFMFDVNLSRAHLKQLSVCITSFRIQQLLVLFFSYFANREKCLSKLLSIKIAEHLTRNMNCKPNCGNRCKCIIDISFVREKLHRTPSRQCSRVALCNNSPVSMHRVTILLGNRWAEEKVCELLRSL